jgi:phospholipase C
MRTAVKWLIFLVLLGTALCYADSAPGQFKHVIIVVQENRTPDNLFGGVPPQNGWTGPWFENGVDLAIAPTAPPAQGGQPGQPWCLGACFDPGHGNSSWHTQHANGLPIQKKDPSNCGSTSLITFCNNQPVCGVWTGTNWAGCSGHGTPIPLPKWPEESFVGYNLDMVGSRHLLDPYVQIATQYGFGNYFYQTNQGPSQPAHNFLLGGTAAPTGVVGQNNFYNYFASGNDGSGCQGALSDRITLENPDGNVGDSKFPQQGLYPCWERQTMPDLLMNANAGLTWKYYTNSTKSIWVAPNQIQHLCLAPGTQQGNPCNSPNFANVQPTKNFFADFPTGPSLLTTPNTTQCNLPSVAWIIPDGKNSDHPGLGGTSTSSTTRRAVRTGSPASSTLWARPRA